VEDLRLEQKYKVDVVELKKIMVEQKLDKIIDLSAASTVDRNTLSKVINGDIKPSTSVIEKLMSALHIPPEKAGAIFFSQNLRNT
jgi:transcriptional regulator with XRE-family HTH domain